ncbi:GNAT family N-acetyltransferase [Halobaculum lipolyticum]|uniref:GNAT family N-acetyltransferase n=1 Tax=Halobaculum lipolyticum TaxID=3032001 RepID=A0ABD5WA76_9EURY|nr:GNAT family N-acetyltransferase [Halobaculum sp. DT31]
MSVTTETREGRSYTFRRYERGDERGFLDLFETTWGERRGEEWFRWRFVDNPYLDHVPMFVAETDGRVVGVRPYFAFRMRVAGEPALALSTVDTMVHPDHRGRGLFTTMTRQSLDFYADEDVAFVFNQPNAASRPGFESLGFRRVDPTTTYHRVQRPGVFLAERVDGRGTETLARGADLLAAGYHRLTAGATWDTEDVAVTRTPGVATRDLVRLSERATFPGITADRDAAFYEWRFASPAWRRSTYVASADGDALAAVIARTRTTEEGVTVTQIADVAPTTGCDDWRRGVAACTERVIADATHADVVSAAARSFPAEVAASYGFRRDDRLPLSAGATADGVLCVLPLGDGETPPSWTLHGVSLCDPRNWLLSFAEQDTA